MMNLSSSKDLWELLKKNFEKNKELLSWVLFYYSATMCQESNTPGNRFDKPFIYEKILRRGISEFGWYLPTSNNITHDARFVYNFVESDKRPYDYVFFDEVRVSQKNWPHVDGCSIIISNEQRLKVSDLSADTYYDVLWIPAYKESTNYIYSFDESKDCMSNCNGKIVCKLKSHHGKKLFSNNIYRAKYTRPMNHHYVSLQEKFFDDILDNVLIEELI
jgi:hypothetical protein